MTLYATAYNFTDYKTVCLLVTKQTLLGLKLQCFFDNWMFLLLHDYKNVMWVFPPASLMYFTKRSVSRRLQLKNKVWLHRRHSFMLHNRTPAFYMGACLQSFHTWRKIHVFWGKTISKKRKYIYSRLHMLVSSILTKTVEKNSVLKLGLLLWLHMQHKLVFLVVEESFNWPLLSWKIWFINEA